MLGEESYPYHLRMHNLKLCNVWQGCDCGDASGSGVWDNALRQFEVRQMCAIDAGLPSLMPRLLQPSEVVTRQLGHEP